MKRKFLEELGLEDEVIGKIMAENGKDITSLKASIDDLNEQINVKDETIKQNKNKIADLEKVDIEALKQEQFEAGKLEGSKEIEVFKKQNALKEAVEKFKAKDADIVIGKLDKDKIEFNDKFEIVKGLEEQITPLKTSHDYLFASEKPTPKFGDTTPGIDNTQITKEAFQKMSYRDRVALKNEQPEIYESVKE